MTATAGHTGPHERVWALPPPEAYTGDPRCGTCAGARITGARYRMQPDPNTPTVLLVDVLCPDCDGCGRATHTGCSPAEHGEWRPGDTDVDAHLVDERDDCTDDDSDPEVCFSCHGRRWWWAIQGFTAVEVYTLRMPCGCAEPLMQEAPA